MKAYEMKKTSDFGIAVFLLTVVFSTALSALFNWAGGAYGGYYGETPYFAPPYIASVFIDLGVKMLFGLGLFLALRASANFKEDALIRNASLTLWGIVYAMSLVQPFAFFYLKLYTFSFIWLAITAAACAALFIVNFRISFASAMAVFPYVVFLIYYCCINIFIA